MKLSHKNIYGIPCHASFLHSREEKDKIFQKLGKALMLIKQYTRVKFSQMSTDIENILVLGGPCYLGRYIKKIKTVELYDEYVLNSETSVEMLASTIVHESQHARLFRLGIGYEEETRDRVERLCFMAEKIFGLHIPNGEVVIEKANYWINGNIKGNFSNDSFLEREYRALDELGCPLWIQKIVKWYVARKST